MMISPKGYIESLKDSTYEELIKERDRIVRSMRKYEKLIKTGDRTGEEWYRCPSPDVIYQCQFDYLAELCSLMLEKYQDEMDDDGESTFDIKGK